MSERVITLGWPSLAGALALALALASPAARAGEVGVSIQVSQPGVYGRIDIGQFPKPQVVVAQPILVERPPVRDLKPSPMHEKNPSMVQQAAQQAAQQMAQDKVHEKAREPLQPVYMWVPPGHRKNWRKHCREYGACGVPVYFVDDRWYDQHVHPRGKHRGKGRDDDERDHGKGHSHGKGKND